MLGSVGVSSSASPIRAHLELPLKNRSSLRHSPPDRSASPPSIKRACMSSALNTRVETTFPVVCLGGGVAAGYLANELVKTGKLDKGDLAIISNDAVVPYERPTLSKAYLAPENAPRLPQFHTTVGAQGEKMDTPWYLEHGISFFLNTQVASADLKAKKLVLPSGKAINFGKLVIATGARPVTLTDMKIPGEGLEGVVYLRSVTDADKLNQAIKDTKAKGGKAVVIGGGYLGLEVGAGLTTNGLPPTLIFPEGHMMARLFSPEIASFYEKFYQDKGVQLMKRSKVTAVEGSGGKVTHVVVTPEGQPETKVPADLVLVAIGARSNVDLFDGQLEMAARGIKVDEHLRSSDPDVYAMGDVATFPLQIEGGEHVRQEHVINARGMAQYLAKELTGTAESGYDYLPSFYSREFNLSWQFYGLGSDAESVPFGDQKDGKFGAYFVRDGKVVGTFLESGTPEEFNAIKKVARERPAAPPPAELAKLGLSFASAKA